MSWFTDIEKYQYRVTSRLIRAGFSSSVAIRIAAIITTIRFVDINRVINRLRR